MPAELRNYYPSARERTEQLLRDLLAGDKRPSAVQASQARGIMDLLDFSPAGVLFGAYDAGNVIGAGIANRDPWQIARGMGLGALAAVPLPVLRKVLKAPMARASQRFEFDPPQELPRPFNLKNPKATLTEAQERLLAARQAVARTMTGGPGEDLPTFTTQGAWRLDPRAQLRASAANYPQRAPAQANGRLTEDVEGAPIARASMEKLDSLKKPLRPSTKDYPRFAESIPAHTNGRLAEDIAGGPLTVRLVGQNVVRGPSGAVHALESKRGLYNLPKLWPRDFSDDYLRVPRTTPEGRLAEDIEGRPPIAPWIVGRNKLGRRDEAFPVTELEALARAMTGYPIEIVPGHKLPPGVDGRFLPFGPIQLRAGLPPRYRERVLAHEIGHAMDLVDRVIYAKELETSLREIYNNQRNRRLDHRYTGDTTLWVGPEHFDYSAAQVPMELSAEARRAYLSNPNSIKTIAPKVARAIRETWNANPLVNKIIHFNGALPPVAAAGLSLGEGEPRNSKEPAGPARIDPSDPRVSDRLSAEEWMELRNSRNEGEETGRVRLNLLDLPPSDGLSTAEWMKRRRKQLGKP